MPITPFHLGPGLAVKAFAGDRFSLMVFAFSQAMMDIEPAVRILRGDPMVHGVTHTYLGATVVAVLSMVVGRPICQLLLRSVRPDPDLAFLSWALRDTRISWRAAAAGAFVGTYSHVLLDSVMHADMRPWAPWSAHNALLHAVPIGSLHLACVVSGVLGMLPIALTYLRCRRRERHVRHG
jgi:hypothetical protein